MPYRKFRPLKQWGKYNTRLFRDFNRRINKIESDVLQIDPEIKQMGIKIQNPLIPNFFEQFEKKDENFAFPKHLRKKAQEEHPLYKTQQCLLFEGTESLTDGIDQACSLINSLEPSPIPNFVYSSIPKNFLPKDFENHIIDSIMAGERYDPSLDKLPKKFDPILFWIGQIAYYGTTVLKRKCSFDDPISSITPANLTIVNTPMVFRQQPHIVIQSEDLISPLATKKEILETKLKEIPNIFPISPFIDLQRTNIYNDTAVVPGIVNDQKYALNTILWAREQCQKYPWTSEENAGNAICHCFGAALAQALRLTNLEFEKTELEEDKILKRPIITKAIQLVNGKMDFVIVQLNTLNLANSEGIKNLVWLDKACSLYKPKPMHQNLLNVEELNLETAKKFVGLILFK
uniref:39S ribosomal protein L37, mitochondrial n=1 Tax=Meloidogyne hapla TaxID=6305 RepID=A0A1I8BPD8_MELHA